MTVPPLEYKVCAPLGRFESKGAVLTPTEVKAAVGTLEQVAVPEQVQASTDGPVGEVEFYAAVTGVRDEVGDIIVPGAFARSLKARLPRVCLGHDWNRPIGRTVEVKELYPGDPALPATTADGRPWPREAGALWVKALYNLRSEDGRKAFDDAVFMGKSATYSIGYVAQKHETKSGTRFLHDVDLWEYGPVLHPANTLATGISAKGQEPEGLETKIRRVKDSQFWGLPVGTPIKPGMKPRGKVAIGLRRDGVKPDRNAGLMDHEPTEAERAALEAAQAGRSVSRGKRDIRAESNAGGLFDEPQAQGLVRASRRARGEDQQHLDNLYEASRDRDSESSRNEGRVGGQLRSDLAVHELTDEQREGLRGLLDEGITPDEVDEELPDDIDPAHRQSIMDAYRASYRQRAEQQGGGSSNPAAQAPEPVEPAPSFGQAARAQREAAEAPPAAPAAPAGRGKTPRELAAQAFRRGNSPGGDPGDPDRPKAHVDDPAVNRADLASVLGGAGRGGNIPPMPSVNGTRSFLDRAREGAPREHREPVVAAAKMAEGLLTRGVDTDARRDVRGLREAMEHVGVDEHEFGRRLDAIDALADTMERNGLGKVKGKGRSKPTVQSMREYAAAARAELGIEPETDYRDRRDGRGRGADAGLPDAAPGSQPSDTPSADRAAAAQVAPNRSLAGTPDQVAGRLADNNAALGGDPNDPAARVAPARAESIAGQFLSRDGRRGRGTVQDAGRYSDDELEAAARTLDGRGAAGRRAADGLRDFIGYRERERQRREERGVGQMAGVPDQRDAPAPVEGPEYYRERLSKLGDGELAKALRRNDELARTSNGPTRRQAADMAAAIRDIQRERRSDGGAPFGERIRSLPDADLDRHIADGDARYNAAREAMRNEEARDIGARLGMLRQERRRRDEGGGEGGAGLDDRAREMQAGQDQRFRDADEQSLRDSIAQNNRMMAGRAGTLPPGSAERMADQNRRMQAELDRRSASPDGANERAARQLEADTAGTPGEEAGRRNAADLRASAEELNARYGAPNTDDQTAPGDDRAQLSTRARNAAVDGNQEGLEAALEDLGHPDPEAAAERIAMMRGGKRAREAAARAEIMRADRSRRDAANDAADLSAADPGDGDTSISPADLAELDRLGDPDTLGETDPRAEQDARDEAIADMVADGEPSVARSKIAGFARDGDARAFIAADNPITPRTEAPEIADAALARKVSLGEVDPDTARAVRAGHAAGAPEVYAHEVRPGDTVTDPATGQPVRVHTTSVRPNGDLVLRAIDPQTQDSREVEISPANLVRRADGPTGGDQSASEPDGSSVLGTGEPDLRARETAAAMAGDEGDGFTAEEDAAADQGISPAELDEARAEAFQQQDSAMGVAELPDGDVEVEPEVAERQSRVEGLLTRASRGDLDLTKQTDAELGDTRQDLVDELALQNSLHRRNPAAYDARRSGLPVRADVEPGRDDGSGNRNPDVPGNEADVADVEGPAEPTPRRRPGVAGAAEDYAEALESGQGVELARENLLSSLRRSSASGEGVRALRAHLESDDPDDAATIRGHIETMRAETRARRNDSARRRRTAKRLERDRIRSLIGQVDAQMRSRNLDPESRGGKVESAVDAAHADALAEAAAMRSPGLYALTEDDEDRARLARGEMINAQYRERVALVEAKAAEALARGMATEVAHADGTDEYGEPNWTPERRAQHDELIADFWREHVEHVPREGRAMFSGGLGGAGKGTILGKKNLNIDKSQYAGIDPDEIKEMLVARGMVDVPEGVSPMEMATLMHEESSYLSKRIQAMAFAEGRNVILDNTMAGKDGSKVRKLVGRLRDAGYTEINAAFVEIPVETSVERALSRHRNGANRYMKGEGHGGRYVPPSVIRASADPDGIRSSQNIKNFEEVSDLFDNWAHYDNSGAAPEFVKGKGAWATDPRLTRDDGSSTNADVLEPVPTSPGMIDDAGPNAPDSPVNDSSTTLNDVDSFGSVFAEHMNGRGQAIDEATGARMVAAAQAAHAQAVRENAGPADRRNAATRAALAEAPEGTSRREVARSLTESGVMSQASLDAAGGVNNDTVGQHALDVANPGKLDRAVSAIENDNPDTARRHLVAGLTQGHEALRSRALDDALNTLGTRGDPEDRRARARQGLAANAAQDRGSAADLTAMADALRENRDGVIPDELAGVAAELADDLDAAAGEAPDTGMRRPDELRAGDEFMVRGRNGSPQRARVVRAAQNGEAPVVRVGNGRTMRAFEHDGAVQVLNHDRIEPSIEAVTAPGMDVFATLPSNRRNANSVGERLAIRRNTLKGRVTSEDPRYDPSPEAADMSANALAARLLGRRAGPGNNVEDYAITLARMNRGGDTTLGDSRADALDRLADALDAHGVGHVTRQRSGGGVSDKLRDTAQMYRENYRDSGPREIVGPNATGPGRTRAPEPTAAQVERERRDRAELDRTMAEMDRRERERAEAPDRAAAGIAERDAAARAAGAGPSVTGGRPVNEDTRRSVQSFHAMLAEDGRPADQRDAGRLIADLADGGDPDAVAASVRQDPRNVSNHVSRLSDMMRNVEPDEAITPDGEPFLAKLDRLVDRLRNPAPAAGQQRDSDTAASRLNDNGVATAPALGEAMRVPVRGLNDRQGLTPATDPQPGDLVYAPAQGRMRGAVVTKVSRNGRVTYEFSTPTSAGRAFDDALQGRGRVRAAGGPDAYREQRAAGRQDYLAARGRSGDWHAQDYDQQTERDIRNAALARPDEVHPGSVSRTSRPDEVFEVPAGQRGIADDRSFDDELAGAGGASARG